MVATHRSPPCRQGCPDGRGLALPAASRSDRTRRQNWGSRRPCQGGRGTDRPRSRGGRQLLSELAATATSESTRDHALSR
jgi:hypothetical protein